MAKKQNSSNKHLDFVALLRSSMHVPEKMVNTVRSTLQMRKLLLQCRWIFFQYQGPEAKTNPLN